jgi:hypothetical protein
MAVPLAGAVPAGIADVAGIASFTEPLAWYPSSMRRLADRPEVPASGRSCPHPARGARTGAPTTGRAPLS